MLRALLTLLKISIVIAAVIWISQRPGHVEIVFDDTVFTLHLGLFCIGVLAALGILTMFYNAYKMIGNIPKNIERRKELKRHLKGYRALGLGLTAVAAGDGKLASYQAYRAKKFMPDDEGLTLLLQAQADRLQGHDSDAQAHFKALMSNKDTAFIGYRGMLQAAIDRGDQEEALTLGRKAMRLQPKTPWVLQLVYDLELKNRQWKTAQKLLARLEVLGLVDTAKARLDHIAMLIAQSDDHMVSGDHKKALKLLNKAKKLDIHFVPTITRLVECYIAKADIMVARGKTPSFKQAQILLKHAISDAMHPDYLALWDRIMPRKLRKDHLGGIRWAETAIALNDKSADLQLYGAQKALDLGLWGEARNYLEAAERLSAAPRIAQFYLLRARLSDATAGYNAKGDDLGAEEREIKNKQAQDDRLKAVSAPNGSVWMCAQTGRIYHRWHGFAHPHNSFNTMIWAKADVGIAGGGAMLASKTNMLLSA